jgi:DNA polymerase-3 subunit epsilon
MGWSPRKSTSLGPFRLSFSSRSGLGLSFGVKGARISVNKEGTYVNLGAHGIYYRQKINGSEKNKLINKWKMR